MQRNFLAWAIFLGTLCGTFLVLPASMPSENGPLQLITPEVGGDASGKIAAAIARLPSTGGTVDARGLIGVQTLSVNPFAGVEKPVTLLTGKAIYHWDTSSLLIDVPSNFRLVGQGTTFAPKDINSGSLQQTDTAGIMVDGAAAGLLNTRVYATSGSIASGSNILTVISATNLTVGMVIGVMGAAGGNAAQRTTLRAEMDAGENKMVLDSASGFPTSSNATAPGFNFVVVDNEIIGWSGLANATLNNLIRGAFGTVAASHDRGSVVQGLGALVSEIKAIQGTRIVLSDKASFTVNNTQVQAGAVNVHFEGDLTFDGRYIDRSVVPAQASAISGIVGPLTSHLYVGSRIKFQHFQHGGVFLIAGRHNSVQGHFNSIGRPAKLLGADVWLFDSSCYNRVRTSSHQDGDYLVLIDDRSSEFSRYNGPSSFNNVEIGPMSGPAYRFGIGIEGFSSNNTVRMGYLNATTGIQITSSGQWPAAVPVPSHNSIFFRNIKAVTALETVGYSRISGNTFHGGKISGGRIVLAGKDEKAP